MKSKLLHIGKINTHTYTHIQLIYTLMYYIYIVIYKKQSLVQSICWEKLLLIL